MNYGYVNGRVKYMSSSDDCRAQYPEAEWVCQEIHDQRDALRDKAEMRAYDIFKEMERSIKEFNSCMEELTS